MAVLFPDPVDPMRNTSICSLPPLAFNILTVSSISAVVEPLKLCCRYAPKFVCGFCASFTNPRKMYRLLFHMQCIVFHPVASFQALPLFLLFLAMFVLFVSWCFCLDPFLWLFNC